MDEFEIPSEDPIDTAEATVNAEGVADSRDGDAGETTANTGTVPEEGVELENGQTGEETTPPDDPNSKEYTDFYMHKMWNAVSGEIAPPAAPSALPEDTYLTIQTNLKAFAGDVPYETWTK